MEHKTIIRSPYYRRNRWTNREAGNGRFPGMGLIRMFGDVVHIALHTPIHHNAVYSSPEDAIMALSDIFKDSK